MKKTISISAFLIGFTAMAAQIIFARELLIVFYGNELSISFILASWLAGGAIGSFFFGRYSDKIEDRAAVFCICQLVLAVLLPSMILAIRSAKNFFSLNAGEIIGFFPIISSSFIILVPFCAILGFMFPLACRLYETKLRSGAESIGRVYILEAIGAVVGGALISFILVRFLNSFQIVMVISVLNVSAAFFFMRAHKPAGALPRIAASALGLVLIMWVFGTWTYLDKLSVREQWKGYELVSSKNSIYGNIAVTKKESQVSFFENGLHLYTIPDELTSEENVHFAMLEHLNPKRVLLIGGGVGGLVEEILKYPVEKVDYVEIDPLILKMAFQYLHKADSMPLDNEKVSIINMDGRYFIKNTKEKYDCVIIALGDPCTAQLNRFYTVEFFKEVSKVLNKKGVISFGISSSENYVSKELRDLLASLYGTLKKVFKKVLIIPGDTAYFVASNSAGSLTYDYKVLMDRAHKRGLNLQYVREYYLFSRLSHEKISNMENGVKRSVSVNINYDFRPISYYYDIAYWSSRFKDSLFSAALKNITKRRLWNAVFALSLFIILFGAASRRFKGSFIRMTLFSVMACGFTSLAFQVLVLISFQILYGYLYYKLGVILTCFMAGLVLGTFILIKTAPALKKEKSIFMLAQSAVAAYPLLLSVSLWFLTASAGRAVSWIGANVIFIVLPVISGAIGAFQFLLGSKIYLGRRAGIGRASGLSYGVDLFGSCLGAVVTGTFLVPVLGITATCTALFVINAAFLAALFSSRIE